MLDEQRTKRRSVVIVVGVIVVPASWLGLGGWVVYPSVSVLSPALLLGVCVMWFWKSEENNKKVPYTLPLLPELGWGE